MNRLSSVSKKSGAVQTFLKWIGRAVKERLIQIPGNNGSISWTLPRAFLEQSDLQQNQGPQIAQAVAHSKSGR
jgi:hypothetical protein